MSTRVFAVTGLTSATLWTSGAKVMVPPVATASRKLPGPASLEFVTTASANAGDAATRAANRDRTSAGFTRSNITRPGAKSIACAAGDADDLERLVRSVVGGVAHRVGHGDLHHVAA